MKFSFSNEKGLKMEIKIEENQNILGNFSSKRKRTINGINTEENKHML